MGKLPGSVSAIKGLFSGSQELVGVDIGSHAVKVVWLAANDKTCHLKGWGHSPLQFKSDATPEEKKFVTAQTIKGIFERQKISCRTVATSVSGNAVIVRYISIPKIAKKDLPLMLAAEAEPYIPFDIKDVNLGCHIIGDVLEDGQKKTQLVLVAAKRDLINEKLEILKAAGLSPLVIDVDAFTLETVFERLPQPEGGACVALNIGNKVTNLVIIEGGMTRVARDILIAGNTFTRTISKTLGIEPAKAEELKRLVGISMDGTAPAAPGGAPSQEEQACGIITGIVRDLAGEVHRSLDFYLSQAKDRAVSTLYITGGSASLKNLASFLASELKINVEVVTPLSLLGSVKGETVPPELAPSLTVATGLALRKLWDWE